VVDGHGEETKTVDNAVLMQIESLRRANFGRKHQTLGTTPAVKAGVADHIWSVDEVIGLLEAVEPKATRPARKSVSN
jgi:hypothetical protein